MFPHDVNKTPASLAEVALAFFSIFFFFRLIWLPVSCFLLLLLKFAFLRCDGASFSIFFFFAFLNSRFCGPAQEGNFLGVQCDGGGANTLVPLFLNCKGFQQFTAELMSMLPPRCQGLRVLLRIGICGNEQRGGLSWSNSLKRLRVPSFGHLYTGQSGRCSICRMSRECYRLLPSDIRYTLFYVLCDISHCWCLELC